LWRVGGACSCDGWVARDSLRSRFQGWCRNVVLRTCSAIKQRRRTGIPGEDSFITLWQPSPRGGDLGLSSSSTNLGHSPKHSVGAIARAAVRQAARARRRQAARTAAGSSTHPVGEQPVPRWGKQHPQSRGSSPWRHGCQSGFRGGTRSRVIGHLDRRRSAQTLARVTRHPDSRMGRPNRCMGEALWRPGPTRSRTAHNVLRRNPGLHVGEALFGRLTLSACIRPVRSENDPRPTHGRSPVWRADPRRSYERSLPRRTLRVAARLGWSFLITP
jgi:hypothetical protein